MNIAIYYPWVYLTSGIERTILEITKLEEHTFTIFTHHFDAANTFPELLQRNIVKLNHVSVKRDVGSVAQAALTIATTKLHLKKFDLLLVQSDGLADLIMLRNNRVPTICFCHTPLRPVFDPYYQKAVLKNKGFLYKNIFHVLSFGYKCIDKLLWQRYSNIIFNSQETKQRAINGELIKPNQQNVTIIHPGIDSNIKPSPTFKPFFFLPGRIMWTKNIELAIKAFIQCKKLEPKLTFKLIIAGRVDTKSQGYLNKLRQLCRNRPEISFIINPTDDKLSQLYQTCWAVLSSAFNEDWGLTVLEGNAHGKPVIAINRGGPTESQIDLKTGILVKPKIKDFATPMLTLANDERLTRKMGLSAHHHAKNYSWIKYRTLIKRLI
jgi:glycosyltransferase involved in cell wall biosynthesis